MSVLGVISIFDSEALQVNLGGVEHSLCQGGGQVE